jgi:hypothetical protein
LPAVPNEQQAAGGENPPVTPDTRKEIYELQISPYLERIKELCVLNSISFFAVFQVAPDQLFCTSKQFEGITDIRIAICEGIISEPDKILGPADKRLM